MNTSQSHVTWNKGKPLCSLGVISLKSKSYKPDTQTYLTANYLFHVSVRSGRRVRIGSDGLNRPLMARCSSLNCEIAFAKADVCEGPLLAGMSPFSYSIADDRSYLGCGRPQYRILLDLCQLSNSKKYIGRSSIPRSVQPSPAHHLPQPQGSEPYFLLWYVQAVFAPL